MTLIVNENGKKLSKRDKDTVQFIEQYANMGYLPEALFNFIALLGWSPGIEEEILDFIKRDTAWACIKRLLGEKGFFSRILEINQTGHWACSWVGKFPKGNFIIL